MKRAALYMRVSTVDQHPESQLFDLEALAQQRGFEIVQRYTDRITGTRARRPGLDQMMADARRGQFDVVLVWACDRLARSVRHFLEVLDELNHLNVEFISLREQLDTGGPLGRAVIVIIAAIAELEAQLDRRTRSRWHEEGKAGRPAARPAAAVDRPRRPAARSGQRFQLWTVGQAALDLEGLGHPRSATSAAWRHRMTPDTVAFIVVTTISFTVVLYFAWSSAS